MERGLGIDLTHLRVGEIHLCGRKLAKGTKSNSAQVSKHGKKQEMSKIITYRDAQPGTSSTAPSSSAHHCWDHPSPSAADHTSSSQP
jgi:hypothetical protein